VEHAADFPVLIGVLITALNSLGAGLLLLCLDNATAALDFGDNFWPLHVAATPANAAIARRQGNLTISAARVVQALKSAEKSLYCFLPYMS
jgi:hypothetical protein